MFFNARNMHSAVFLTELDNFLENIMKLTLVCSTQKKEEIEGPKFDIKNIYNSENWMSNVF